MKKIYLLLIFFLLALVSKSQVCLPLDISTNPNNPYNNQAGCQDFVNDFDWQANPYTTPYYTRNNIQSPFTKVHPITGINNLLSGNNVTGLYNNYYVEDGWELLKENVVSSESGNEETYVYFILYNKFSSVIRVFAALDRPQEYQYYAIKLRLINPELNNNSALLHPSSNLAQPLDEKSITAVTSTITSPNDNGLFIVADFPVEYDPCPCVRGATDLTVTIEGVVQQKLSLYGRYLELNQNIASSGLSHKKNVSAEK